MFNLTINQKELENLIKQHYDLEKAWLEYIEPSSYSYGYNGLLSDIDHISFQVDDNIRVLACSKCGALDNEKCKTINGFKTHNHKARLARIEIKKLREEKRNAKV